MNFGNYFVTFMHIRRNDEVGLIVARNLEAATVFNSHGIDFYSQGKRTLEHACLEDHVPINLLQEELWDLKDPARKGIDFVTMNLRELAEYILRTHHAFAEQKVVFIRHTLDRLGNDERFNTDVDRIRKTFGDLSVYLTVHMKHKEFLIFPFIMEMEKAKGMRVAKLKDLEYSIATMTEDHHDEVSMLKSLAELTDNYSVSPHWGHSWKLAYDAMKELEADLKFRMHLENNILFPKALNLAAAIGQNLN